MFSPRYQYISNINALMARRVTFFGRSKESNSGPLDRADLCVQFEFGHERALGLRSTQPMRFVALTASYDFSVVRPNLLVSDVSGTGTAEPLSGFRRTLSDFLHNDRANDAARCTHRILRDVMQKQLKRFVSKNIPSCSSSSPSSVSRQGLHSPAMRPLALLEDARESFAKPVCSFPPID